MSTLRFLGRLAVVALAAVIAFGASAAKRDFDGDGKSDVAWYAPGGTAPAGGSAVWLMSGTVPVTGTLIGPTAWWWVSHTGDFNGDGKADLVIHDKWTGKTGIRLMHGTTEVASAVLHTSEITVVTHVGDFDGDGKTDLLWLDQNAGVTALWLMDGLNVKSRAWLLVDPNWRVTHVADFNGDGKADLLWIGPGGTAIWLMDGTSYLAGTIVMPIGSAWYVTTTGDFNGDGKADLVWRRDGLLGTKTSIWLMDGLSMAGGSIVTDETNWYVLAVADLNGDRRDDLIWQKVDDDGFILWIGGTIVWLMDGLAMTTGNSVPLGDTWVMQAGDFDGDGRGDLLTQRCIPLSECYFNHDALFEIWLMDGASVKSTAPLMRSDFWHIVP